MFLIRAPLLITDQHTMSYCHSGRNKAKFIFASVC